MQTTPATTPSPHNGVDPARSRVWLAALIGATATAGVLVVVWLMLGPTGGGETVSGLAEASPTPGSTPLAGTGTESGSTDELEPERCEVATYSIQIPQGWTATDCRSFTPGLPPSPGSDSRTEIDLFWANKEGYEEALARIEETLTVRSQQDRTIAGRPATAFRLDEVDDEGTTGGRLVFVVDAEDGVFFAAANELVRGVGPIDDHPAHFIESVEVLEAMMTTVEF